MDKKVKGSSVSRQSLYLVGYLIIVVFVVFLTGCSNDSEEQYLSGKRYWEEKNYIEAVKCFRKAADHGHADACYELASSSL